MTAQGTWALGVFMIFRPATTVASLAVAASTLASLLGGALAAQEVPACGATARVAELAQVRLSYLDCGSGEPLVFVHGTLGDLHTFDAQLGAFAKEFRVVAYSRRYHPPNAAPPADATYAMAEHVADLAALITELGAGPAHVLGSSYGAYVALVLALEQPKLVRSLVLGEPPVLPLLSATELSKAVSESFATRALRPSKAAFEAGDAEDGVRRFLDGVSGQPGRFDQLPEPVRKDLMNHAAELRLEMSTEAASYMPPLACASLARLRPPVLLVSGEKSPTLFLLVTGELERCLAGEAHVMVPDAGHSMHAANAPFYNQAVLAFLRRH